MRVLYFGAYDPSYSRNRVLIKGLRMQGVEVIECASSARGLRKYLELFKRHWKLRTSYDIMMVGFPGQEVMLLAWFISRKPIVFDCFTSHYGGYILDRGYYARGSWRASYYRFLDRWSCKLADHVLLDTQAHIDFFVNEFGLQRERFSRIFVGSDSELFKAQLQADNAGFTVHFHGSFIPLQGVRYIIEAANILREEPIFFNIIGRGQTFLKDHDYAINLGLTKVRFMEKVPYYELPSLIAKADIALGIFGNTAKTDLVIPNKVFEAMAVGRAIITADTPAVRELLTDHQDVLFCKKADAQDLADKIMLLKQDTTLRSKIAHGARLIFDEKCSEAVLGKQLLAILNETRVKANP